MEVNVAISEELLKKIEKIAEEECDKEGLELVKVSFYHDSLQGDILEILVDKDFNITIEEVETYSTNISTLLDQIDELDFPYSLDVASGGSSKEIPYDQLERFISHYLDIKTIDKELKAVKLEKVEDDSISVLYFIKGRKKIEKLDKDRIQSIKIGFKA